ncbi:HTH_Tnp_Tc3_2 domain-containing protein [Trichonephila clavipes]|nr:HTH_Tnp_Tc3_2 domain-containing protein [Trichonephila clavipes]
MPTRLAVPDMDAPARRAPIMIAVFTVERIIQKLNSKIEISPVELSVREGRNGGKEVKLFTSALKAFQYNNRIVMAQRKHLDDFLSGRIIGRLECGRTQLEVSEELGITQSVISRL